MLIPLTRKKFEQLVPFIATGAQYKYYWGKFPDFLKRLLISVIGAAIALFMELFLGGSFALIILMGGIAVGTYWLWGPIFWASRQNLGFRKYAYSGFWRSRVLDLFITEELIGQEETVNNRGELVIVENRERCLNLEVGDDSGFVTQIKAPLRREHKAISLGQVAELIVVSKDPDLSRIARVSDVYIPKLDLWVSDYPYLQRDAFEEVSQELRLRSQSRRSEAEDFQQPPRRSPRNRSTTNRDRQPTRRRNLIAGSDWDSNGS